MKFIQLLEDEGIDDTHVNALHDILNEPVNAQGHEWEGHGSGIYINLSVAQGDTILVNDDNSIRVLRKGQEVAITKHTFPMVHACMLLVEMDNGAHHLNRIAEVEGLGLEKVDLESFKMPYDYGVDKLCAAENAIGMLTHRVPREEFDTFVCGEQTEQEELVKLHLPECPGLDTAHALLNDWFNAWETA